jgi:hypothetical protein
VKRTGKALALLAFVFSVLALRPQVTLAQGLFGTISGTVTDASGAVVPGATVKVTSANTHAVITLATNAEGVYVASSLNPGTYTIQAEAAGFKTAISKDIVVEVGANPRVNLTLQVGQSSETVSVVAESALLKTEQSNVNQMVTTEQLRDLPVQSGAGRSLWNLVPLSSGVTLQVGGGGYALDNMRINGGRPRMDDYLLDGTSVQAPVFGGPVVGPSVDSIQELNVQTNAFSAEYGKVSGGVISAVTKSGSNEFHGSAYEYVKNDSLNARDFFAASNLPLRFNEFGGTLGGPALKNKLFFFTDYQGIRASTSTPQVKQLVPSAAFRNGDLSALTAQLVNPATKLPYPGNQVPVSTIAKKLLEMYPAGNGGPSGQPGVDYWNGTRTVTNPTNRFNPRVDWNAGANDRVFGVYHFQRSTLNSSTGFGGALAGTNFTNTSDYAVTAGWTHTFSPTLINDFRFGISHHSVLRTTNGYGVSGVADFGISGFPECKLPQSNGKCGAPTIGIGGYTQIGGGGSMLAEPSGQKQFSNIVTKVAGRHTVKIGGEIRRASIDNIQPNQLTGSFSFNGSGTGHPFGDFLLGYLNTSSVQVQNDYLKVRGWADAAFVQDDFKVSPRLTINAGFRWQYDPSWTSPLQQIANFDPYSLKWEQNGINAPEGAIDTHWKEFAPRVGFAWNPRGGFVVRGGYGITYPGYFGHGRGGDAAVSPNVLAKTTIPAGTYISNLPKFNMPNIGGALTTAQGSYAFYTPRKQSPTYVQQWNLTLEQQLSRSTIAQIAYTGSRGVHLPIQYNYNICQQSGANLAQFGSAAGNMDSPYCGAGNFAALGGFWNDYVYPGWWGISNSTYHALQMKLEKRYSNGFAMLSNFTWSKLIDDSSSDWSGFGSLDAPGTDFYNRRNERSVSAGDVPLRLMVSPIYELPFGRGKKWLSEGAASQVFGGWRVSGIYTISSGEPVGVSDYGYNYCNAARMITVRPMMIGNPLPGGFRQSIDSWFNGSAFDWSGTCAYSSNLVQTAGSANPAYAFGDAPRFFSNVRAPRLNNLDFSLQKEIKLPLGEQGRLRFRADGFNVFNHTLFGYPQVYSSANFGKITSTRVSGRILQLGLHLYF